MNTPVDITEKLSGRELPRQATPSAPMQTTPSGERRLRTDLFGGLVLTILLSLLLGQFVLLFAMG